MNYVHKASLFNFTIGAAVSKLGKLVLVLLYLRSSEKEGRRRVFFSEELLQQIAGHEPTPWSIGRRSSLFRHYSLHTLACRICLRRKTGNFRIKSSTSLSLFHSIPEFCHLQLNKLSSQSHVPEFDSQLIALTTKARNIKFYFCPAIIYIDFLIFTLQLLN